MPRPSLVKALTKPLIFNTFKYVGMNSYDVIRTFKRNLPAGYGKIGHFGTLDPFACGVLLIAVGGATRLNEYIHADLPKTYLAIGKLGVGSETGDNTGKDFTFDESVYLGEKIAKFPREFIEQTLQERFVGDYLQSPHKYSAAKFQGRALHKWAREGVDIVKEQVKRQVHSLEVVRYSFPYLSLRVTVSSGTYVRTLFSDCARYLGTHGLLVGLVRESIGHIEVKQSLRQASWPIRDLPWNMEDYGLTLDKALPLPKIELGGVDAINYINGIPWSFQSEKYSELEKFWVYGEQGRLLGLGQAQDGKIKTVFNLPT